MKTYHFEWVFACILRRFSCKQCCFLPQIQVATKASSKPRVGDSVSALEMLSLEVGEKSKERRLTPWVPGIVWCRGSYAPEVMPLVVVWWGPGKVTITPLMINCWFGARWFGIRIGVSISYYPFHKGNPKYLNHRAPNPSAWMSQVEKGSMDRISGLSHLPINGVFLGVTTH